MDIKNPLNFSKNIDLKLSLCCMIKKEILQAVIRFAEYTLNFKDSI